MTGCTIIAHNLFFGLQPITNSYMFQLGETVEVYAGGTRNVVQRLNSRTNKEIDREMNKKPDLMLVLFVLFGLGIAVNAVGQVMGL